MRRTPFVTGVIAALAAGPALAHPGHGVAGWLHHGEVLALAGATLALALVGGAVAARVGGRGGRTP